MVVEFIAQNLFDRFCVRSKTNRSKKNESIQQETKWKITCWSGNEVQFEWFGKLNECWGKKECEWTENGCDNVIDHLNWCVDVKYHSINYVSAVVGCIQFFNWILASINRNCDSLQSIIERNCMWLRCFLFFFWVIGTNEIQLLIVYKYSHSFSLHSPRTPRQ